MNNLIPVAAPHLDATDIAAAVRVLCSGHLVQGAEVAAFEDEFAELVERRHCVAVNSGSSALWLTLLALGIGPGDEVIVPSFTFAATAAAVRLTGATTVFADINPGTFCLDPDAVRAAITPRTAAIIPVHLFGHPAAMHELTQLAEAHQLALVEDAAQAHGASLAGRPVATFGAAGCFSFYPTKNIQAIEGGLIATADPALARTLRMLRNQGMEHRYHHQIVGTNARMNDVSAAIARSQLRRLPP
jgi:perosamine synthetase